MPRLLAWTPLLSRWPCGEQRSGRASSAAPFGRSNCIDAAQMVTWPTSWTHSWLQPCVAALRKALIPCMSWICHLGRCATPRSVAWRILHPKRHYRSRVGLACHQFRPLWSLSGSLSCFPSYGQQFIQPCFPARSGHASRWLRAATHTYLMRSASYLDPYAHGYAVIVHNALWGLLGSVRGVCVHSDVQSDRRDTPYRQ